MGVEYKIWTAAINHPRQDSMFKRRLLVENLRKKYVKTTPQQFRVYKVDRCRRKKMVLEEVCNR